MRSGGPLEFVTQGAIIAPFEATFFALALARLNQVLQAAGAFFGRRAALGAALVSPMAQLIFPLPRNRQAREFILDPSHTDRVVFKLVQSD